jgi:TPP-dependent 2-oxoacid decarboxylase
MSHFMKDNSIVIAETGVSLFSAAEMLMPEGATFIGQTFYGSIGYTVGATLGAAWRRRTGVSCCLWGMVLFKLPARTSRR